MEQRLSISHIFCGLVLDPFYGDYDLVTQMATDLRQKLLQPPITFPFIEVPKDLRHNTFRHRMNSRPTLFELLKLQGYDPHLELIHVWCGLARLNTYQAGEAKPTGYFGSAYVEYFHSELEIDRDDFKDFLRKRRLPLPAFWFPEALDNSRRAVEMEGEEFHASWDQFVRLGEIEDEIEKWTNVPVSTVNEQFKKKQFLDSLRDKRKALLGSLKGQPPVLEPLSYQAKEPLRMSASANCTEGRETFSFRKEGDFWAIAYEGEKLPPLKNGLGLRYIACLLRYPHQEIHSKELIRALEGHEVNPSGELYSKMNKDQVTEDGLTVCGLGDSGPILDSKAKAEYKERLNEIQKELGEAQRFNDLPRAAKLQEEMGFIKRELKRALGLGGKDRREGDTTERVRKAVTNRIKTSLKKISKEHSSLGQHLSNAINTGTFCSYTPEKPIRWNL
jgi:hypothetical protein